MRTIIIVNYSYTLADIRIFDNEQCHRAYDTIFDPKTEICAGDYDQRTDTMVNTFLIVSFDNQILFFFPNRMVILVVPYLCVKLTVVG